MGTERERGGLVLPDGYRCSFVSFRGCFGSCQIVNCRRRALLTFLMIPPSLDSHH